MSRIDIAPDARVLLEQAAAAAGTTADEHLATLILRDAQTRGLLGRSVEEDEHVPTRCGAVATQRPSVIAHWTPAWGQVLETYPPAGLC